MPAEELHVAGLVRLDQHVREQASEEPREHAHEHRASEQAGDLRPVAATTACDPFGQQQTSMTDTLSGEVVLAACLVRGPAVAIPLLTNYMLERIRSAASQVAIGTDETGHGQLP
jgi:hypothetical protein